MSTYAIGDVQGCYSNLRTLLDELAFSPSRDSLWLAGDLVNRGPDSLGVLRFCWQNAHAVQAVLGNHDLHLLARASGGRGGRRDTLDDLLAAEDAPQLLDWLRHRPVLVEGSGRLRGWAMCHAGIPPAWSMRLARRMADQVAEALQAPDHARFLQEMYGDEPRHWLPSLRGRRRLRYAVNAFTRMRYIAADGGLELRQKGPPANTPQLTPWFAAEGAGRDGVRVVFGHWSTLGQVHWPQYGVWGLDTGAVWGGSLTALTLETLQLTQLPCPDNAKPGNTVGD